MAKTFLRPIKSIVPDGRPPSEIKAAIAQKSDRVREASQGITERIEKFEKWLATIKGRTETVCAQRHPDAHEQNDMSAFGIKLQRENKEWKLVYASYEIDDDSPADWKPLSNASLRTKLLAIKMFPDLLEKIEKTQEELVKEIEDAASEFDLFAEALGIDEVEGK